MDIKQFLDKLKNTPEVIAFDEVMQTISEHYVYQPTSFTNGTTTNEAGSNEGSCKLFAFARLHQLTEAQTLACFGQYYREDVLQNPQGKDHANIRSFMQTGWAGITFDGEVLSPVS